MSILSLLNTLILRSTTNPPLTNKGAAVAASEEDGNWVKVFNALQDVVNGANVTAYDAGNTYDYYSTDVAEKFAGYDNKIWKAVYVGSPSNFSGQTPAEGSYWTQVTLAQILGNPIALTKMAEAFDDTRGASIIYETDWLLLTEKDIFTNPVTILLSGGVSVFIVPISATWSLDAGATAFDFGGAGIWIAYDSDPTTKLCAFSQSRINSATDNFRESHAGAVDIIENDKLIITSGADATVGDGTYYCKLRYRIVQKPF
jgi:hypothetical protein